MNRRVALLAIVVLSGCASAPAARSPFAAPSPSRSPSVASGLTASAAAGATAAGPAGPGPIAEEPGLEPLPPVSDPAPERVATEAPEGPPIDATLVRFGAEARARRGRFPAGHGFPGEACAAWRALASELDAYLGRALPQTPLLELVRARVTVEAEWDYDQRRYGAPPADLKSLVERRAARIATRFDAARALGLALFARPAPARLRWPIEQAGLTSTFGYRVDPLDGLRRMHAGIDLAAGKGRVVSAAAQGWVVRAGFAGGYGLTVEVRHPGDLTTRYSHLSALLCAPGDAVGPGRPLGLVGQTGRATGPHLHFEVWLGGAPRDPLPLLGLARADGLAGN